LSKRIETEREYGFARVVDAFERDLRTPLWNALGLDRAVKASDLWPWVDRLWSEQRLEGERLLLHLPKPPRFQSVSPPARELIPFVYRFEGWGVHAFVGHYLRDDTERWPARGRSYVRDDVQPLARVALAATKIREVIGCTPLEATLFLLCATPLPEPRIRVSVDLGLHVWSPWRSAPLEEIRKAIQLSEERTREVAPNRSRPFSEKVWEMIAFVDALRPHSGKHKENAPWEDVHRKWECEYPDSYADAESMRKAYNSNKRRRREAGFDFEEDDLHRGGET
jgi:hypothetical protein